MQSKFPLFASDTLHNVAKGAADELGIGAVAFPLPAAWHTDLAIPSLDELAPEDARRRLPRVPPEALRRSAGLDVV